MRRLGQHFLTNQSALKKISASLEIKPDDLIIEIGPGTGNLTFPLIQECQNLGCRIIALEKDPKLATELISRLVDDKKIVEIIHGDALELINSITEKLTNWKLVGNIPYYITGRLLRVLGELSNKPKLIVLTIQKEVAQRLTAQPPNMNLLAAATQFWSESKIISYLEARDFTPAPKIDSAIIRLATLRPFEMPQGKLVANAENYYKFIKIIFKQPRKTILNNIKQGLEIDPIKLREKLNKLGLSGQERPQNLNLAMLINLSEILL